jgi:radical SAM superfamily enzyme YgiQ (UPF0313 family)
MKILIVSANREKSPYPVAPLGVLFVAEAAMRAGHETDVLDMAFARSPSRALKSALSREQYDLVALGIRNLDNSFYSQPKHYAEEVEELAATLRELTTAPLVLGGGGFSLAPRQWLKRLRANWGVVNEGERAFPALLNCLAEGRSPEGLPGVVGADEGESSETAPATVALDEFITPAHERCAYADYLRAGGFVSVQSKRGCPFNCIYCVYPQMEGRAYRLRPPEQVAEEVEQVARQQQANAFFFTDSVFNQPREHALALCDELAKRRLPVQWMTYCNPLGFDRELAEAMVRAGCVGVEFGLDAVTDKMLANMGKPFAAAEIRDSLQAAVDAQLPCAVHLLFGGPGETLADVEEAQRFLDSYATPNAVFAGLGIRIYQGAPIEEIARREGVLDAQADLFYPQFYVSELLGRTPQAAVDEIAHRRAEWSTPTDWAKPMLKLIQGMVNRFGGRPQWRNVRNYGKYIRRSKR